MGVLGLGYVGLPLAVEAASAGVRVLGFDVNPRVVDIINSGRTHIQDLTDADVARVREQGLLEATTDMSRLAECEAISICVPTPLSKTRDPDVSFIIAATEAVAGALRKGQLVVLESTTYPGTTREVLLPALERDGMKVGEDFFLCFSPERVDPGNEVWKTKNTPKVIGGMTHECAQRGAAFYSRFIDNMVPVSSAEAAELTKLLENTFRAVNIGLVNEIALIADKLGVDVWEVIDAAATKPFGFMKFTPGPGLGGHCIPIDPLYLSWKMRSLNYTARFIELASQINSDMPLFVVGKVREALNRNRKAVNGSTVLVLGVAYKKDIDDVRESPALDIIRLLEKEGAHVKYHDPYVPEVREDGEHHTSVPLTDEALAQADAVVIITDHSDFDYDRIVRLAPVLIDTRNATSKVAASSGQPQRWIVKG
ncbi:MAG: nucleotide sugar dehydrogenase [Gemmatimonadota bacterium]